MTAVEWLEQQLKSTYDNEGKLPLAYTLDLVKQAKIMEKEQIIENNKLKAIVEFYEQGCGKEGCKVKEPHVR